MMRNRRAKGWIWLLMCLLLTGGCGGPPSIPEPPREEKRVKVPQSLEMGGSVMRMAAPEGGWKFEARSKRAMAPTIDGPYVLMPMEGRYEAKNKPPVLMRADRAEVDEAEKRVTLLGSVWVSFGRLQLEADRVEYDLATGKVVAEGRTKWAIEGVRERAE